MGVKLGVWHKGRNIFENRVQRRIFGQKRDEVIGGWKELHVNHLF
jgi:hypothetical protein